MKISIKIFAYVVLASFIFLSCANSGPGNSVSFKDVSDKEFNDNEVDSVPHVYDSTAIIISDDVKKWMEEQLASGNVEKRHVWVSDMFLPKVKMEPVSGRTATNTKGETVYYVNDKEMTVKEYEDYMKNWWKEYYEKLEKAKRYLPFSGLVWVTAAEIAGLVKEYDGLAIDFFDIFQEEALAE